MQLGGVALILARIKLPEREPYCRAAVQLTGARRVHPAEGRRLKRCWPWPRELVLQDEEKRAQERLAESLHKLAEELRPGTSHPRPVVRAWLAKTATRHEKRP